jgi:preprotein translocase subunit SecD
MRYWPLKKISVVSGNDLRRAWRGEDPFKGWAVHFELSPEAGRASARSPRRTSARSRRSSWTTRSCPLPRSRARSGARGRSRELHEGERGRSRAQAALRRAQGRRQGHRGADRRTIPRLDSIRKGITASIVGFLAVMIFMVVYYKGSGINAVLALAMNVVILLG